MKPRVHSNYNLRGERIFDYPTDKTMPILYIDKKRSVQNDDSIGKESAVPEDPTDHRNTASEKPPYLFGMRVDPLLVMHCILIALLLSLLACMAAAIYLDCQRSRRSGMKSTSSGELSKE